MSVAEMHGVWASGGDNPQWVKLSEIGPAKARHIELHYGLTTGPLLTPEQARYLASKLNRMARRLESGT